MVKQIKMISLDADLIQTLKEKEINVSGLINDLLRKELAGTVYDNMSVEDWSKLEAEAEAKAEYEKKIQEIKNGTQS